MRVDSHYCCSPLELFAAVSISFFVLSLNSCSASPPLRPGPELGGSGCGSYFLSAGVNESDVPGIDRVFVGYGLWRDETMAYLVWTDLESSMHGNKAGGSFTSIRNDGEAAKEIRYKILVGDQKTSSRMVINGQEFLFKDGTLFLVSMTGNTARINQMQADLSKLHLNPDTGDMKEFLESTPDIHEFFGPSE